MLILISFILLALGLVLYLATIFMANGTLRIVSFVTLALGFVLAGIGVLLLK